MKKILIVDDHAEVRNLVKLTLGSKFKISDAANAHEASQRLADDRPDLILLDVMMPGIDGLDWCRMIKEGAGLNQLKIIIVSAKSQPEDYMNALHVGADGYIEKPFSPLELQIKVEEFLMRC